MLKQVPGVFFSMLLLSSVAGASTLSQQIYDQVAAQQVKQSSEFKFSHQAVQQWDKQAGLYASYVHINLSGGEFQTFFRHNFQIFDNNFFVTAWVMESLIHSHDLNPASFNLPATAISSALNAELTYYDKNNPNTTLVTFWPQKAVKGYYQASPQNLEALFGDVDAARRAALKLCEQKYSVSQCEAFINKFMPADSLTDMEDAFHIPSDTDDSSLNLSLGATLYLHRHDPLFSTAYQQWQQANPVANIKSALEIYIENAYQPDSANTDNNLIDPRSFYAMHGYAFDTSTQHFPLLTTWTEKLSDEKKQVASGMKMPVVAMPLNDNNVDPSVQANFIYAMTLLDQTGLLKQVVAGDADFHKQLDQLIVNSASYIAYVIQNDLTLKRPDITITYYPSKYNLYWFASRITAAYQQSPGEDAGVKQAVATLSNVLQHEATTALLKTATQYGGAVYWDDFLGDGDTDPTTHQPYAEDRLFSTAVAVNALLNIWTDQHQWLSNTPDAVKTDVSSAVAFLKSNILTTHYRKDNAFFSGSVKGMDSLPFVYPANYYQYLDGRSYTPGSQMPDDPSLIFSLQKQLIPSASAYDEMVKQSHFGFPTPTTFSGFNDPKGGFPYWSAPALTYAFTLEAIEAFDKLS